MKFIKYFSPFVLMFPILSFGNPPTMDIGTYSIDSYIGNATGSPGVSDLSYENQSATSFFEKARAWINFFQAFEPNPSGHTSLATLHISKKDKDVTKSAITDLASGSTHREYCDFLFFGGHGFPKGIFLGSKSGYGKVYPTDIPLGKDYNRYMLINSCSIFKTASPLTDWNPAFGGLKALLGFKSLVTDNPANNLLYDAFWYYWTLGKVGLSDSFAEAQNNYGTSYVGFPGVETGCISAQPVAGTTNYCSETFKNVAHSHDRPASGAVYYHQRIVGSPIY